MNEKLPAEFYLRPDTLAVARDLIGKILVVPAENGERVSGIIVETEAYVAPEDKASHAFGNKLTRRNAAMFGAGGTAYVFLIYGMYFNFNVVTNVENVPHAVLIRAVQPLEGLEIMKARRGAMKETNLTSGPGKLCIALGIDATLNGENLLENRVWLEMGTREIAETEIVAGKRIGIDYAEEYAEKNWRFWLKNNSYVSRK